MAGTRVGIILGFVTGSAAASVLQSQTPDPDSELRGGIKGVLDKIRARAREAIDAGKEASKEREEQLRQEYEAEKHRQVRKPS